MPEKRKARITKRVVDALKPGEIVWDTEIKGFGVRCQVRNKTYVLKKNIKGRQRWLTLGSHSPTFTASDARKKAEGFVGQIAENKDPARERDNAKARVSVAELCKRYLEDYALHHKKVSSVEMDKMNIRNHIVPLLGCEFVEDLDIEAVDRFKRAVKEGKTAKMHGEANNKRIGPQGGPGVANRCLALLSKMINLAIRWGVRKDASNPVRFVEKYKERKIERYLSEAELLALGEALHEAESEGENPFAVAAIRLLLFTGARRGEILGLKWEHVDVEKGVLRLPTSKTGAKVIHLNAPAREVLASLPRLAGNPYVICGEKAGSPLVNLKRPWRRIKERANRKLWAGKDEAESLAMMDLRIHDLRHSFASMAVAGGLSLPMIGKLLGHTQVATTHRYAHLADDPVRAASDIVGGRIAALMPRNRQRAASAGK